MKNKIKMVKIDGEWFLPISEEDRKRMNADEKTGFKKTVSSDGSQITFKKINGVDAELDDFMADFYNKHGDLMAELADR